MATVTPQQKALIKKAVGDMRRAVTAAENQLYKLPSPRDHDHKFIRKLKASGRKVERAWVEWESKNNLK